MEVITQVSNVEAFIESIHNYIKNLEKHFVGAQFFYRGQENESWNIEPSIKRQYESESEIIRKYFSNNSTLYESIALTQHYKTGTRFIDFTTDIDVALFFACRFDHEKDVVLRDGALFVKIYFPHSDKGISKDILSEIALLNNTTKGVEFTVGELASIIVEKHPELLEETVINYILSFLDYGFMVTTDSLEYIGNERLKRQKGAFYICGSQWGDSPKRPERMPLNIDWKKRLRFNTSAGAFPNDYLCKLIIPLDIKGDILMYLHDKGITQEYLFPLDA